MFCVLSARFKRFWLTQIIFWFHFRKFFNFLLNLLWNFFVLVNFLWFFRLSVKFLLFSHFLLLITAAVLSFLLWDRGLLGFIFKISHFFFSVSSNFINNRRINTHIQMISKTLWFSFLDQIFSVSRRLLVSCLLLSFLNF